MKKSINSELYSRIVEEMPICCVDLVIIQDEKVLLIKRKNKPSLNEWFIPGGRVYKGETLKQAALRKSQEEIGLKLNSVKLLGVYEYFSDSSSFDNVKSGTHSVDVVFIATVDKNQKIILDNTSSEYTWIKKIDDCLHPFVKSILIDSRVFSK